MQNIDTIANSAISVTGFSAMLFNPYVALGSLLMNSFGALNTALTNGLVGNGLFNAGDLGSAVLSYGTVSGYKKINALMIKHFVFQTSEQDISNLNIYGSKAQRRLLSAHNTNIMNRLTDEAVRGVIMAAQMIHDGSWDAYSLNENDELVYDETKDKRFYENGKLTEDGAILREKIKEQLILEPIHSEAQQKQNKLVVGYTLAQGRKFKAISDRWVMGSMDSEQQAKLFSYTAGRMIGEFKRYLPDKILNWFNQTTEIQDLGDFKIVTGPDGKKMAEWQAMQIKGVFTAFKDLVYMVSSQKRLSYQDWKNLPTSTKQSLVRASIDILMLGFIMAAVMAYKGDFDDEEEKKKKKKSKWSDVNERYLRVLDSLGWDQVGGSPVSLIKMYGGYNASGAIPSMNWAWRMISTINDPVKMVEQVAPGRQAYDLIATPFETETPE
jgi:hypothetical protein